MVVVENDMGFLRRFAHRVTVMHEDGYCARARWPRCRPTPGCRRSTSAAAATGATPWRCNSADWRNDGHVHRETRLSILLIEQYLEFALRLAEHYVVLDAGEVVASGDTASLQDDASVRRLLAV